MPDDSTQTPPTILHTAAGHASAIVKWWAPFGVALLTGAAAISLGTDVLHHFGL